VTWICGLISLMLNNIESVFRDTCKLTPDRNILVGVSGGPDSLCLMESLRQAGYSVIVAHFNHQLRPDSDIEANALEKTVSRKMVASIFERGDVHGYAEREGMSIEEAARTLRYRFLFEQARECDAQAVAVGHTADDQVETVLMHFLRGAGLTGLKGMSCRSYLPAFDEHIPVVRPLLEIWREETVLYCAANGLRPYYDPSNDSLNFLRNRIRHLLIPQLESYNPRFREALWRTARSLAGDYAALNELLDATWEKCVKSERPGLISFDTGMIASYEPGLQRNLIRRAIDQIAPDATDLRFSVLDRASEFLSTKSYGRIDLTGGVRLFIEGERAFVAGKDVSLPFERWPQMPPHTDSLMLSVPGQLELSGGWTFSCEQWRIPALALEQALNNGDPFQVWLDAKQLPERIEVRARRSGDRFEPIGMDSHSMKLSDFFINEKLPQRARDAWPLLCSGDTVIWVPGYRPAHPFRLTDSSRQVMYFTLTRK
jgi:tRNA(Ile)-lysidine synthase